MGVCGKSSGKDWSKGGAKRNRERERDRERERGREGERERERIEGAGEAQRHGVYSGAC